MKPNELRIGNVVSYKGKLIRIGSLIVSDVWLIQDADEKRVITPNEIKFVPLTPEIFKQCGFKTMPYQSHVFEHKKTYVEFVYTHGWTNGKKEKEPHWHFGIDTDRGDGVVPFGAAIDYLHQLQNFIHIYTGKELDISKVKI